MKTSSKQKKSLLTKDFNHFITYHITLSREDVQYIKNLFQHDHIKKTFRVTLIILVWSFINAFVDVTLLGVGVVGSAMEGFSIVNFIPWILFVVGTFTLKYLLVSWIDKVNDFSTSQKMLCSIPNIGVFFFLSSVLAKEELMLKTTREYFRYVRRRGLKFIIDLLNKAVPLK